MSYVDEDSVRRPVQGSVPLLHARAWNQDLYVHALRSVYLAGYRVWEPSYADSREPDLFEKIRRDPVVAHAIEHRLHAVAGKRWHVEPGDDDDASKKLANIVEEVLDQIEGFTQARYELAQAVIVSRAYAFIESRRAHREFGGIRGDWWLPTRLKDIDRRRIRWYAEWADTGEPVATGARPPMNTGGRLRTRLQMYSLTQGDWLDIEHPEWFVRNVYNDQEARLGYGRGLQEAIYFYHFAKGVVLKEGLQGLERWAQGLVTAKIDGLRPASTGKTNQDLLEDWLDVLEKARARHAVVYDSLDEIEILQPSGTGHQMVVDFLRYLDEAITQLIIGAIRTTGGGGGGSYARAQEEGDSSEMLVQYDRTILDETITRDLVGAVLRHNRPLLRNLLDAGKMPRFTSIQEKREDPEQSANVAATLLGQGVPLRKDELYERCGFTPPKADDDVYVPPSAGGGGLPGAPGLDMPELGDETDGTPGVGRGVRPADPAEGVAETPKPSEAILAAGQITAAIDIVAKVTAGEIPRDAGLGLLRAGFSLGPAEAEAIMGSAGTGSKTTPNEKPPGENPVLPPSGGGGGNGKSPPPGGGDPKDEKKPAPAGKEE